MKKKVYLAKSNRSDPDVVQKVRKALDNFEVEVVEYKGGTYTNGPLLECDTLLIVKEHMDHHIVGKGLATQIKDFQGEGKKEIYLVQNVKDGGVVMVDKLTSTKLIDEKQWFKHTATFTLKEVKKLEDILPLKKEGQITMM